MRILIGVLLAVAVAVAGGLAFVYSGVYNVAASAGHTAFAGWLLHTTMHQSVHRRAHDISPPPLDRPDTIERGATGYDDMCAQCHLRPGLSSTPLHTGLTPQPPDFTQGIDHLSEAEQFWIIKHGIKFTAMPAWGEVDDEDTLWAVVAFLQRLPELSEQEYEALIAKAEAAGHGHHHHDH
jgi:mono/diheme cytochrome c family protein